MGADGGVKLTKMEIVRSKWPVIRERILAEVRGDSSSQDNYYYTDAIELLELVEKLPAVVVHMSYTELVEQLKIFKYRDCPYLFIDVLVTGRGDNISYRMNLLSDALKEGEYIETWT